LEIAGISWKFYAKCVYHHTSKVGFYNKTHTTSEHTAPRTTDTGAAVAAVAAASETPTPSGNHSPFIHDDDEVDLAADGLHFDGALHTPDDRGV